MSKPKPIGLRDLAAVAKVDQSTVSRALNHDPRLNEDRAASIRQLAEEMGYRPRPIRSRKTKAVGLLVTASEQGPRSHFVSRAIMLAERALSDRGYHANVSYLRPDVDEGPPPLVQENRVDGVIFIGHPITAVVKKVVAMGVKAVGINHRSNILGVSCVSSDPFQAMRDAVLRLAAWGHTRFGLAICSNMSGPTIRARHQGFLHGLADAGFPADAGSVLSELPVEILGGRQAIDHWQDSADLPTALLFENDWMAMGAIMRLQQNGIDVPGQVSVVGHDDIWWANDIIPPLTSIRRSEGAMATHAVESLLSAIEGQTDPPPRDIAVPCSIVWRDSAGPHPDRRGMAGKPDR